MTNDQLPEIEQMLAVLIEQQNWDAVLACRRQLVAAGLPVESTTRRVLSRLPVDVQQSYAKFFGYGYELPKAMKKWLADYRAQQAEERRKLREQIQLKPQLRSQRPTEGQQ